MVLNLLQKLLFMANATRIRHHFIQPGKPMQNAYIESEIIWFEDAWIKLKVGDFYNEIRPHSS